MLYPKIGIRPVIDGRWGGVRESLEAQTMAMAENAAKLISENLKYPDGTPVQCSSEGFSNDRRRRGRAAILNRFPDTSGRKPEAVGIRSQIKHSQPRRRPGVEMPVCLGARHIAIGPSGRHSPPT